MSIHINEGAYVECTLYICYCNLEDNLYVRLRHAVKKLLTLTDLGFCTSRILDLCT
jgi:hypothetical protein